MQQEYIVKNLKELNTVAKQLVEVLQKIKTVGLIGEMGAGKTTLVKAILEVLDVSESANSPTFSLINIYQTPKDEKIFHLDLYRLNDLSEAFDIGIEDVLYDEQWCFIEWPEIVIPILPENYALIHIVNNNLERKIILKIFNKNSL
jgi:tRNA threonylcarbamoyladenosine biosynthesis protein TsaE